MQSIERRTQEGFSGHGPTNLPDGAPCRNGSTRAPLSWDLRDFPHILGKTKKIRGYPFGEERFRDPAFQKFITLRGPLCLRVSGAVAPSAPSFTKVSEGVSREGSFADRNNAPPGGSLRQKEYCERLAKSQRPACFEARRPRHRVITHPESHGERLSMTG
jgi:hypothetical protein